jgi:hypothetical protein
VRVSLNFGLSLLNFGLSEGTRRALPVRVSLNLGLSDSLRGFSDVFDSLDAGFLSFEMGVDFLFMVKFFTKIQKIL